MHIKKLLMLSLAVAALGLVACGGDSDDPEDSGSNSQDYVDTNLELKGDYTVDITLTAGQQYAINGEVNFLEGTTLTIPAGTTLYGVTGASYLAINRGAMIMADGTAADPILFTSATDIAGNTPFGTQGQWGGLTLLGDASASKGERTYEAGTQLYGPDGTATATDCPGVDFVTNPENCGDDDDNSGVLDYVIIKYSGFTVELDKELNGLSLAGVGSGTSISNIAIIGSADDGIELWGGTVDVDGLYVFNAGDDSIDTDQGYRGTISNVYVEQYTVDAPVDSRGLEADGNDETVQGDPVSEVLLQNAYLKTISRGIRLREGTSYTFDNVQVYVDSAGGATDTAALRMSNTDTGTGASTSLNIAGDGLALFNNTSTTGGAGGAYFANDETEDYIDGTGASTTNTGDSRGLVAGVLTNDESTLPINTPANQYDYSWAN